MEEAWRSDPFDSDYYYWLDAGLLHYYIEQTMTPENIYQKLIAAIQPVWLTSAYFSGSNRFQGYKNDPGQTYLERTFNYEQDTIMSGTFGGIVHSLTDSKYAFRNLLNIHFHNRDLNSEEGVWTLMQIRFPYLYPNNMHTMFQAVNHTITIKNNLNKN